MNAANDVGVFSNDEGVVSGWEAVVLEDTASENSATVSSKRMKGHRIHIIQVKFRLQIVFFLN